MFQSSKLNNILFAVFLSIRIKNNKRENVNLTHIKVKIYEKKIQAKLNQARKIFKKWNIILILFDINWWTLESIEIIPFVKFSCITIKEHAIILAKNYNLTVKGCDSLTKKIHGNVFCIFPVDISLQEIFVTFEKTTYFCSSISNTSISTLIGENIFV